MNKIKNGFKLFIAIVIVLGSFNSVTAMEEEKKEYKEYKVISKELWQQIFKDDALRERLLREKIKECIANPDFLDSPLSVWSIREILCEQYGVRLEEQAIYSWLIQHCNSRAENSCESFLAYIIEHFNYLVAEMFILAGADVNGRNFGCTPLFNAVLRGSRSRVKLLLDAGADIDLQLGGFCTALHEAVVQGNLEIVKLLLERGADPNIANKYLGTPLDLAVDRNCEDIVELLQHWKKHEQD